MQLIRLLLSKLVLYLFYYKKQVNQLAFNTSSLAYSLDSFPIPIRANTCLLPLKLLSFSAQKESNNVSLKWQTANEINVSHFNIQRSTNGNPASQQGKDFIDVGSLNANCCNYSYNDDKLPITNDKLTLHYRLEIVDKDGSKTYSTIKQITIKPQTPNLVIYPNPAKGVVNIECADAREIKIIDYLGKTVKYYNNITEHQTINTQQFTKGIYAVKVLMNNSEVKTAKLVVE